MRRSEFNVILKAPVILSGSEGSQNVVINKGKILRRAQNDPIVILSENEGSPTMEVSKERFFARLRMTQSSS